MFRKTVLPMLIGLAVVVVFRCSDNDNVTGPPAATPTPGGPTVTPGGPTTTPVPPTPAATVTPTPAPSGNRRVDVGASGNSFVDQISGNSNTVIQVGQTVDWVWASGPHSVTSGSCSVACTPDGMFDSGIQPSGTFSFTFNSAGTFPYFCQVHGAMMSGTVTVQ